MWLSGSTLTMRSHRDGDPRQGWRSVRAQQQKDGVRAASQAALQEGLMTALLGVGPGYADKGLPSASWEDHTQKQLRRISSSRQGRRRVEEGCGQGGGTYCSLGGHTESCPGKHAHPGLACQRRGPLGLLALPGPELLTCSDEGGPEGRGWVLNKTCDPGPVLSSDVVRQPESLVDVLYKGLSQIISKLQGTVEARGDPQASSLPVYPRSLTWSSQRLP